jgi:hypothetical protein
MRRLGAAMSLEQRVLGPRGENEDLRQPAAVARLGEDPQPLGQEQPPRRRAFLSRSARSRLTVGLEKAVIWRGITFQRRRLEACAGLDHQSSPKRSSTSAASASRLVGAVAFGVDGDRVAHRRAEHHQAHDRGAADPAAVLLDLDRGGSWLARLTNLALARAWSPRLVGDLDRPANALKPRLPRGSRTRPRYICARLARGGDRGADVITLRAPSSRISIGRLTPAMTSIFSLFIRLMARLDGVPPNRSVRMITPLPWSTAIASAMSLRAFPCRRRGRCRCLDRAPADRRHAPWP